MRASRGLGLTLVAMFAVFLAACVSPPPFAPDDPQLPAESTAPVFSNIAPPPSTAGPSDSPVPTTDPGDFSFGETVTIHTSQGSTWEITLTASIDPADSIMNANGEYPPSGSRFVIAELTVENVGVIETHPYYDLTFGYQPDNGPVYDQNSASLWAAPNDLGYEWSFAPGDSFTGQVVVVVPASSSTGSWVISGDALVTSYRFS